MKLTHPILSAAVFAAFAGPFAFAQAVDNPDARTGVSHPDETVITTSDSAYVPYKPKPSAYVSSTPAPAPTEASAPAPTLRAATETLAPGRLTSSAADPDAGMVTRVPGPSNGLPEGTLLKIRLHQSLSTISTAPGTIFDGDLIEPVERDGHVLLPAGTILNGRVTEVQSARRIQGGAAIHLQPQAITLPDGTHYLLHAQVIDTNQYRSTKVDSEGTIIRRDHPKETAGVLALSTGSGIATGAVIAGPAGAVVGGLVGAGVGTTVWLKQDRQAALPTDTIVTFSLDVPLLVDGQR